MQINCEKIKCLIELSINFEEADEILSRYTPFHSDKEKIAYLYGMFDCGIVDRNINDIHTDYVALLTSIINKKWM